MLATVPSRFKPGDDPLNYKPSKISTDCVFYPEYIEYDDTIDNPLQKVLEPDVIEENIFERMKSERNRLYSFQNKWPLNEISPESLAEAGLFYLQHEDKVQCPFCYIIIFSWTQNDKPLREHMRKSPKCPFLMGCDVGNIPISPNKLSFTTVSYKPKYPRMSDVRRRLLTYAAWPLNKPEPQQLAECGLYYSGATDIVTCFFCGGTLGNWEPHDDPWEEHVKFFPECSFLALAKNKKTNLSKKIQSQRKEISQQKQLHNGLVSADATSEIVKQALNIFPEDLVLKAVENKAGNLFSLQNICDDILALKEKPDMQTPAISHQQATDIKIANGSASATSNDLLLCKVCMDRERSVVFQPCGHFVSCWRCANLIEDCPVCRRQITQKIKTYIS